MRRSKQIKNSLLRAVSIVLLFGIFFQTISKLAYIVSYSVNKNYIAKNLCENRGKPKMNCNGKCHLKKQLERAEKNESQGKADSKEKWENLYCTSFHSFFFPKGNLVPCIFNYQTALLSQQPHSVFHPPCV
jgi:hypothetical protein